jgi:hypothetical protein
MPNWVWKHPSLSSPISVLGGVAFVRTFLFPPLEFSMKGLRLLPLPPTYLPTCVVQRSDGCVLYQGMDDADRGGKSPLVLLWLNLSSWPIAGIHMQSPSVACYSIHTPDIASCRDPIPDDRLASRCDLVVHSSSTVSCIFYPFHCHGESVGRVLAEIKGCE